MNKCEFYGGTEFVSATETKIKCKLMPNGGKVFENASEEGKETSLRCWHGGIDCPLKAGDCDNTGCTKEKQLSFEEAVETGITTVERDTAPFMEKAATLHRRILVNGKIAAESIVAMAKDLRVMNEEKLYTYLGCESFNDYCEQKVGIKQRHAYNFIKVLDKYGEQQLAEISHLGIAKLVELTALDEEDRQELIESGAAEEMSVRELKEKIKELESRCEQLTLDIEEERDKNNIPNPRNEIATLETQVEELKGLLAAANNEKDQFEEGLLRLEKSKAALIEEHRKEKQSLKNEIAELKDLKEENDYLVDEISKLRREKGPIIKTELSEEDMERLRDEGRDEERERYLEEHKAQEDRHKEAIKALKDKADDERITAVNAARKQEAAKYTAEIEKLKAENTALQSNAKSAPPDDSRERIKFYLGECQRAFNSALEAIKAVEDENIRTNFKDGMKKVVEQMGSAINA